MTPSSVTSLSNDDPSLSLPPHIQITNTWNTNTTPFLPLTSHLQPGVQSLLYNNYSTIWAPLLKGDIGSVRYVSQIGWKTLAPMFCTLPVSVRTSWLYRPSHDTSLLESGAQRLPGRVEEMDGGVWSVALSIAIGFYHVNETDVLRRPLCVCPVLECYSVWHCDGNRAALTVYKKFKNKKCG
jgi:hypothetical protein